MHITKAEISANSPDQLCMLHYIRLRQYTTQPIHLIPIQFHSAAFFCSNKHLLCATGFVWESVHLHVSALLICCFQKLSFFHSNLAVDHTKYA